MATTRNPVSCIFFYNKRVLTKDPATGQVRPAVNKDGSFKENANYISFLQVISCYWEVIDEPTGKMQLNIFLNGGSISRDRDGNTQMKAGYTLVLPQFLGERFMDQFYVWSCAFGISASPSNTGNSHEPRERQHDRPARVAQNRQVREDEFAPLDDEPQTAYFEASAEA